MQKHAQQFTALQHERPSKIETIWPLFAWPTCLLQNEGSCAHGFAWQKKVPYKRTPGFYKINKSYKNTARLQKHVPKMGLGIQFSYWNTVCKGPQAQPFGRGNFDVHILGMFGQFRTNLGDFIWNNRFVPGNWQLEPQVDFKWMFHACQCSVNYIIYRNECNSIYIYMYRWPI